MSSPYVPRAPRSPLDTSWLDPEPSSSESDDATDSSHDVDSSMPLPPETFYTTEDELFEDIQAWAKEHKYAFRKLRSKPISNTRKKIIYICDRCGDKLVTDRPNNDP
jgi:formylmethanofuran dehydrogenase subunit E